MPPNILCGGHRYPYQMENAIKVVGIVFSKYHLGYVNILPGSCDRGSKSKVASYTAITRMSPFLLVIPNKSTLE